VAVKLLFNRIPTFIDSAGDPLDGGLLFTYAAGSSTKQSVYTTSAGSVAHSNPIVLNSRGEPTSGAMWGTTGETYKFVLAPSTDTDPPTASIWTIDNVPPINDTTVTIDEWVSGPAPTFIGTTSFSLIGDQTTVFHVGRRLKTTNTGGTIYSVITVSAFTTLTTITVVNDSGELDSGLSAVSYGLLSEINPSLNHVTLSTAQTISGVKTYTKATWTAEGANIASAADCDIWGGADGGTVHVTGTTQIDDWGTAPQAGAWMRVIFDGALLLNYNATTNDVDTGADITTVANDSAIVYARSTSSYQVFYRRKDGTALKAYAKFLDSDTGASAASLTLTVGIDSTYDEYLIKLTGITTDTDGATLWLRCSVDGGSSYDASGTDYLYATTYNDTAGATAAAGSTAADEIALSHNVANFHLGSATNEFCHAKIHMHNPSASTFHYFTYDVSYVTNAATGLLTRVVGTGQYAIATAVDAIQIRLSSTALITGTARLYGIHNS